VSSDGGLRQLFRDHLRAGWHWQSLETTLVAPGTPDLNGCRDGTEVWVENKQTTGWNVTLRPAQVAFLVARAAAGGRTFVAVRKVSSPGPRRGVAVDALYLCDGARARELKTGGLRAGVGILGCWNGGPGRWDWPAVERILLEYHSSIPASLAGAWRRAPAT